MDFINNLDKLARIIDLSIDVDPNQKNEWLKLITTFKNNKQFDLSILTNEITSLDLNQYNEIFEKRVNNLSKKDIVQYSILALNYMENRNIDTTLEFLENFNKNIKPSLINKIQRLKEKQGFLDVRQRSLNISNFGRSVAR